MTFGFQTVNDNNIVTIDEDTKAYVYLGKYGPNANGVGSYDVTVTCAGYPLVFISLPHNVPAVPGDPMVRAGVSIAGIRSLGGNQWQVTVNRCDPAAYQNGVAPMQTWLRVFGRLDLNFPNGSNETHGVRVWDSTGALVFDSGLRMMRLAGNTYDTEIALSKYAPGWNTGGWSGHEADFDTVVNLPFNLSGKSVSAGARGLVTGLYLIDSYFDVGAGYNVTQWGGYKFGTGYAASGNTLYARKVPVESVALETYGSGPVIPDMSNLQTVYTRLAVIDDSQFP